MVTREDVEGYLVRMELPFQEIEEGLWVVGDSQEAAPVIVNYAPPLLVVRVEVMTAPRNAAVTPCIARDHRATYFSLESLVGRLLFSGVLWGLSGLEATGENGLEGILRAAAVIAIGAFAVLALSAGLLTKTPKEP